MTAALLAFVAALICGMGARDQLLVAHLTIVNGRRGAILALAAIGGILATGMAVWMAGALANLLVAAARDLFVALTVAVAGLELLFIRSRPPPGEPTGSLGAFGVVVLAHQLGDATRLMVGAVALATTPAAAALGGTLGALVAVFAGWLGAEDLAALRPQRIRPAIGAAALVLAAALVISAFL